MRYRLRGRRTGDHVWGSLFQFREPTFPCVTNQNKTTQNMNTKTNTLRQIARRLIAAALVVLISRAGGAASALEYWVSPSGNDTTGSGTAQYPWQTMAKARDFIRLNNLNDNMAANIVVNFTSGEYPILTTAVAFGPDDSGSNGYSVVYRAASGPGTARLVGCSDLNGWTQVSTSPNIWKISVGTGKAIDTIFENDVRSRAARSPNYVFDARYPESCAPYKVSAAGGNITTPSNQDWIQYNAGDFTWPASFTTAAKVLWWGYGGLPDWGIIDVQFNSVDTVNRKIFMAPFAASPPQSNDRYLVQGIYEFLDVAGEFFYSSSTGWLYYSPRNGNPNAAGIDIRVPLLPRLISVIGSAPGTHAHHLKFEGFQFAYASASASNAATLQLQSTDHIEVLDCQFSQVGWYAIRMWDANADNLIYGCSIQHTAHSAIFVQNTLPRATYPSDRSERHVISNCKVESIGEAYTNAVYTAGVALWNTRDCEVSHCEISGSPRYAITLRGHWSTQRGPGLEDDGKHFATGNVFKYIRATDCTSDSGDGAIVHAAHCNGSGDPSGADKINDWQQLLISGAYAHPSMKDYVPNGIFLDHPNSCLYQRFTDIKVSDTQDDPSSPHDGPFRTNGNPTQTLTNVSWSGTFNDSLMAYARIGLKADFPEAYDPREVVVSDDHTADYTETGVSVADSAIGGLYRGDGRFFNPGTGSQYVEWRPTLPLKGYYEVSAWKMGNDLGATAAAPYTITHQTGTATATVNQQTGAGGWTSLGTFPFLSGRPSGTGIVRLSANASDNKHMRADAVRFTFTGFASAVLGGEKGWWGFDANGNDSSGLGHPATMFNVGYSSAIKAVGTHSLYLNGTGYAEVADHADLDIGTGDFAIAGWFFSDALLPNGQPNSAGNLRVLSKGAGTDSSKGYAIWTGPTTITVAICNGTQRRFVSASHSGQNTWSHFAVNISRSGYLTLYVNGVKASALNISDWRNLDLGTTEKLNIGRNVNGGSQNWVGRIDDVILYQRLLSLQEIPLVP